MRSILSNTNFSTSDESDIVSSFLNNGYIIKNVSDLNALNEIRKVFFKALSSHREFENLNFSDIEYILNNFHKQINPLSLNSIRLSIIKAIEQNPDFLSLIYLVSKDYLHSLVGCELAMQKRINLSIQMPNDESSLLTIHADTWQGDSPFEIVVWLPLVDCFNTKSMYLTHPSATESINTLLFSNPQLDNGTLYDYLRPNVKFINIKYGEVLLFNQSLPHGNIVNAENETRWSLNCRFKGLFTPYGDKKLGEFFVPITPKPMSILGLEYDFPRLK